MTIDFICITGIDGSGKTTVCSELITTLNNIRLKYDYVYCGWRRFDSLILAPFIIFIRKTKKNDRQNVRNNLENNDLGNGLKHSFPNIFQNMVLVDYFFKILFNIKIPLILGKKIVCDRYAYDVMISLGIDLGYSDEKILSLLKRFMYLIPKPDIIFLLDVPEEISFMRKDDIPTRDYLSRHRQIFLNLCGEYRMIKIDSRKNLNDINNIIFDILEQRRKI